MSPHIQSFNNTDALVVWFWPSTVKDIPVRENNRCIIGPVNAISVPGRDQWSKDFIDFDGGGVRRRHKVGVVPPTDQIAMAKS
jgi:hypothetical protein